MRSLNRKGVSIVEVLFAIGVVAIGLLGLTAVLPVALHQIGRGHISDTGARLASNAAEDFDVRGMRNPNGWRYSNGNVVARGATASTGYFIAFAIDPQFAIINSPITSTSYSKHLFPYVVRSAATDPRMERVTVLADYSAPATGILSQAQADMIFTWDNELAFTLPEDKTLPPDGNFLGGKREIEGLFSWMATVAPKLEGFGFPKDLYSLSIVVFHRRDSSYDMFVDADNDNTEDNGEVATLNENVVFVQNGTTANNFTDTDFHGDGFHGGDMTLQASKPDHLDIKEGDWVLLMGNVSFGSGLVPLFRWYRVLNADSAPELKSSVYKLDVTLHGADWPYKFVAGSGMALTQVAVVKNVVAVHEKTIRLESSSLW